jgi:ABC-2 type transport system permease protein
MQGFHLVMNLVLFPFLFFSGAFFPLDQLPEWLKILGRLNPLSYGVDMMHLALYADGHSGYFGLPLDLAVLTLLAVAVFYFGTSRAVSPDQ